ncbi:MAG: lipoyltransferase [Duncaniella sp.]|nr:lipoyltransferase [Duncaniella sp.]
MDLVVINDTKARRLPFYLAEEEYLARKYPDRDFFFMWQVEPTVIVGRHQLIDKEVNVDYCREKGIDICRRKSGGGAVVADMNNIMFSYITSSDDVCTTFSDYTSRIAKSLRLLDLDASDNSRNDILIGDRKVSGNSFYHIPGRSIVHGTMLYDFDVDRMANALSPSKAKLASHGVASTKSRVTSIKACLPHLSIADFKKHILDTIIDGETMVLSNDDIAAIVAIEQEYYRDEWLRGKNPKGELSVVRRIDGVGEIGITMALNHGQIGSLSLSGDFLETADAEKYLNSLLKDMPYYKSVIQSVLLENPPEKVIPGLSTQEFINLIF